MILKKTLLAVIISRPGLLLNFYFVFLLNGHELIYGEKEVKQEKSKHFRPS